MRKILTNPNIKSLFLQLLAVILSFELGAVGPEARVCCIIAVSARFDGRGDSLLLLPVFQKTGTDD